MKRIVKLSGKYYGYDLSNIYGDELLEDLNGFLDQGDPIILVNEYEDAEEFGILREEINIIERNE